MSKIIVPKEKQVSWTGLVPAFRQKVIATAMALPHDSVVVFGRRTLQEQQDLYDQGRTQPGSIVTKAQPGMSAHNWGMAADLLPVNPATGKGDWNYDAGFQAMAAEAKKQGLTSGYNWKFKDAPHLEDPQFTVTKAKEWLFSAGTALTKAATSKPGIISAGVIVVGLLTTLGIIYYNRTKPK